MARRSLLLALGVTFSFGIAGCALGEGAERLDVVWGALARSLWPRGQLALNPGGPSPASAVSVPITERPPSAPPASSLALVAHHGPQRARSDGVELSLADPGRWPEPSAAEVAGLEALREDGRLRRLPDPDRALAAVGHRTAVRAAPRHGASQLGYLRIGAIVPRSSEPVGFGGCEAGWYAIEPEGFVCVGANATLDLDHPLVTASRTRPDREAALPYRYGLARSPTPSFYVKIPTVEEQRAEERDRDRHLAATAPGEWGALPVGEVPALLRDGQRSPTVRRLHYPRSTVSLGSAHGKSGFALLEAFAAEGRTWALNAELEVMALDRLRPVEPSAFRGLILDDELTLPIAFVHSRHARAYTGAPGRGFVAGRALAFREAVPLTGKEARAGGMRYLETRRGEWLLDERLIRVERFRHRPGWATPGRTWLDVSILAQSLVAYEGERPVYVTLVSTGADGLGDPEQTHATVRGQFLIHTKHVTITMAGDEVGDEFDLRDVPYVQYFTAGYALHAAYWHDGFGLPRSHGCINLSPLDAAWLFEWTDPPVPERWHGAMSLREGTLIHVRP